MLKENKLLVGVMSLFLVGCGLKFPGNQTNLMKQFDTPVAQVMAHSTIRDWSEATWHSAAVDKIRLEMSKASARPLSKKPEAGLHKLGSVNMMNSGYHVSDATVGSVSTSKKPTGAPGFVGTQGYWIAEDGEIFNYTSGSNVAPSSYWTIQDPSTSLPTTDTFPKADVTFAKDANNKTILFTCSKQGNFYIVDLTNKSTLAKVALNTQWTGPGTKSNTDVNVGFTPAPYVDFPGWQNGLTNGYLNVYAVSNTGTLYQFQFDRVNDTIHKTNWVNLPEYHYTSATGATNFWELWASSPVVINNKISIASWIRRNSTSRTLDKGGFYYFDATNWDSGATPQVFPAQNWSNTFNSPFMISPTVDVDFNFEPVYAFAPVGYKLGMFNLKVNGQSALTQAELVVDDLDPTSDTLANTVGFDSGAANNALGMLSARPVCYSGDPALVFIQNANALWKISYHSSYDSTTNPYDSNTANWNQRAASFTNPYNTTYAKTYFGENNSTLDSAGVYVSNRSYPCGYVHFDPNTWAVEAGFYLLDAQGNPSNSTGTSYNRFTYAFDETTPPTRVWDIDLSDSTDATQMGSQFISYSTDANWNPAQLIFATYPRDNASTTSSYVWALDPYLP